MEKEEGEHRSTMDVESNSTTPAAAVDDHKNMSAPLLKGVVVSNKIWILMIFGFIVFNLIFWPLITVFVILKSNNNSNSSTNDDDFTPVMPIMTPILQLNYTATGIRPGSNGNVLITGANGPPTIEKDSATRPYLFYGTIDQLYANDYQSSVYRNFFPVFPNETVTAAMFYGPNTPYYDPRIGEGNVLAVGTYAYVEYPYQCSFIYEGPLSGEGNYTKIVINNRIVNGTFPNGTSFSYVDEVALTVAHSVMGDFVVGNVYFASDSRISYGLIYNRFQHDYILIERGRSTTLYGIWQNGGSNSTKYTIIGGHSDFRDNQTTIEAAFIENFDAIGMTFTDFRDYYFLDNSSYATHFEGITPAVGDVSGFNLAVEVIPQYIPGWAFIPVEADGSFGNATWLPLVSLTSYETTSDTVVDDFVLGIYYLTNVTEGGAYHSYIYNVTEALALL